MCRRGGNLHSLRQRVRYVRKQQTSRLCHSVSPAIKVVCLPDWGINSPHAAPTFSDGPRTALDCCAVPMGFSCAITTHRARSCVFATSTCLRVVCDARKWEAERRVVGIMTRTGRLRSPTARLHRTNSALTKIAASRPNVPQRHQEPTRDTPERTYCALR